jgi:hypothetical protein
MRSGYGLISLSVTLNELQSVLLGWWDYSGMVSSFAYVGWIDSKGISHIGTYWIDAKDVSGIHPTTENLSNKKCEKQNGIITFEFSRPLKPVCQTGKECRNVIDPISALKMVWAMGDEWSGM